MESTTYVHNCTHTTHVWHFSCFDKYATAHVSVAHFLRCGRGYQQNQIQVVSCIRRSIRDKTGTQDVTRRSCSSTSTGASAKIRVMSLWGGQLEVLCTHSSLLVSLTCGFVAVNLSNRTEHHLCSNSISFLGSIAIKQLLRGSKSTSIAIQPTGSKWIALDEQISVLGLLLGVPNDGNSSSCLQNADKLQASVNGS